MFHIDFESRRTKDVLNFVKYGLTTVLVVAVTVALVFAAGGYDINRQTGEIIQNGLVLIASEPVSADIYINGNNEDDPTSSKFSLPVGQYNFELKREGYRDWSKRVSIENTDVVWLNYPRLIPTELKTNNVEAFKEVDMTSQSPDRRYILVHEKNTANIMTLVNTGSPSTPEEVVIPQAVLSSQPGVQSTFRVVDWAQDGHTIVLEHTSGKVKELILLDVVRPSEAINLSSLYELSMTQMSFIEKSNDKLFTLVNSSLRRVDVAAGTISTALINDVAQYDVAGKLVTVLHGKEGATRVSLIDGDKTYKYMDLGSKASQYIVKTSEFDGERYIAVADRTQGRVFVYQDILQTAKDSQGPQVTAQLRLTDTKFLSFSDGDQFLLAQTGKNARLYDFDLEAKRAFTLKQELNAEVELTWVDGFHLNFVDAKSQLQFLDYDGINVQGLGKVDANLGVVYTPDGEGFYSFTDNSKGSDILNFTSLVVKN